MNNLNTINLKKYLNKYLFGGSSTSNHLDIPDGPTEITRDMVPNREITSVNIPNSVTSIGDYAFGETPLNNVTIGNSVTSIGDSAFEETQLTNVTIPSSVTTIGNGAFARTQLTNVTIPNSVTSIGIRAFVRTPLTNVTIPNSVTGIGKSAFAYTQLTNVTIPNSVTSIGNGAFANTQLTNVTIPNSVTSIGDFAFARTPLTNVTIPNSVTSIGNYAFADTQLTNVTIPNRDTYIADNAFDSNVIITRVNTDVQPTRNAVVSPTDDPNHLNIRDGTTEITQSMVPRSTTSVTIPNSVTSIGNGAFNNTQLTNVTIPNSVTTIKVGAFSGTPLTNVTIPNSVTRIEYYAFARTQLTNVTIPNSATRIAHNAFPPGIRINRGDPTVPPNAAVPPTDDPNHLDIPVGTSDTTSNSQSIRDNTLTIERFIRQLPNLRDKPIVEIDRNSVFRSILKHKNELFNNDVKIKFKGEDGIDCGGLKREFFTLLGDEMIKKYFYEDDGNYCIIKNEDDMGEATIPVDDYYFIGQLFAYAIIVKANINIRLHPVLLHMILNSTYDNHTVDIKNTKGREILSLINGTTDYIKKLGFILDNINKELKYQDRKTNNMDSLQEIKDIMDKYDSTIKDRMPLGRYFTILNMSEVEWQSMDSAQKSLCISEGGMLCSLFEGQIEIPFEKKEWFIDFIIRSYIYGKTLDETETFIRGFHNIIEPKLLRGLSPKDLNTLIAGNSTIDINMFLAAVDFINVGDKLELIHQIIREYAEEDPTYLNEFLYWITGKKTLPHDGFNEFGRQLEVRFRGQFDIEDGRIASHTCSHFVYVELPHNLLVDEVNETSKNKLVQALSKVMIQSYSEGTYNLTGGGNRITLLKNFI
tara:strand:- start:1521 stop:4118 length:2598 start_codon:yes stop_codon:yes gene_type:complete